MNNLVHWLVGLVFIGIFSYLLLELLMVSFGFGAVLAGISILMIIVGIFLFYLTREEREVV